MMKKILLVFSMLAALAISASAAPIASIRNGKDRVLAPGTVVEGVVVSDCHSENNAFNPNLEWNRLDVAASHRTAYIQAPDGSCGIRLIFSTQYMTAFERGSLVSVDLSLCKLVAEKAPERYTVEGVDPTKVTVKKKGVAPAAKIKTISQLTDADIWTQVTVTGLEFLSKQGSFSNVCESCVSEMPVNHTVVDKHAGVADGWAQLLEDAEGNSIYMQVNSLCQWRRNNIGVPGGVGNVTGILVCENNPRYGNGLGQWSLRPLFREDIAIAREMSTSFRTLALWSWDRNYSRAFNLRDGGLQEWVAAPGVKDDAILAESGTGTLYTNSGCSIYPAVEYDTRWCTDNYGLAARIAGSIGFSGRTSNWLKPGSTNSAIIIETSTKGISGKGLLFDFSILAGDGTYKFSSGIPADWTVEYSTDGVTYQPTGFKTSLRPLAWAMTYDKAIGILPPSYSAAMGFCEYSIPLPASLFDQEKLFVRIIPSSLVITTATSDPAANMGAEKFNGENDQAIKLYLGMASVKAY